MRIRQWCVVCLQTQSDTIYVIYRIRYHAHRYGSVHDGATKYMSLRLKSRLGATQPSSLPKMSPTKRTPKEFRVATFNRMKKVSIAVAAAV